MVAPGDTVLVGVVVFVLLEAVCATAGIVQNASKQASVEASLKIGFPPDGFTVYLIQRTRFRTQGYKFLLGAKQNGFTLREKKAVPKSEPYEIISVLFVI